MRYYTGVGSRQTPANVMTIMMRTALRLTDQGYALRSGGAVGADSAFEAGVTVAAAKEIYRPMGDRSKPGIHDYPAELWTEASQIAGSLHPAWHRCSGYAKGLHTRNVFQVLGQDLKTPSEFLLCWTPDAAKSEATCTRDTGGTATAIRLADRQGIEILNLADAQDLARITCYLIGE